MNKSSAAYCIPAATSSRLDALVGEIESAPGQLIDARDMARRQKVLDGQAVEACLPPGLGREDLAGILQLAMLTECATESYAQAIRERAARHDASWLARFVDRVWVPDELTHHTPYKRMLLDLGFAEAELDRLIRETQEREFVHYGGETPLHVTTFGMVQEYLTDHWHGLIANLFRQSSPHAAYMALRVKKRETLHTAWYRQMTAVQIEAEPALLPLMAEELARFRMPGNSLVPQLQSKAAQWLPLMGADMQRVMRDMLRLLHQIVGSPGRLGRLLHGVGAEKGMAVGPFSVSELQTALDRVGGPGYGLVGEAALEIAGLGYLYGSDTTAGRSGASAANRLRASIRSWLAAQMARRVGALMPEATGTASAAGATR